MTTDQEIDELIVYMNARGVPLRRYADTVATSSTICGMRTELTACEGLTLLQKQKEMLESNLSDIRKWTGEDELAKLRIRTEKVKERLRKSREAEKRRADLEKKRNQSAG